MLGGAGGASMPLQSQQLLLDVRTRELRQDKMQHLVFGTLMLVDCGAAIGAAEGARLAEDVTGVESLERGGQAVRPAFAAVSRFVELVEEVGNRHDGLLLGASGDDFGLVWNVVGQSPLHQVRALAAAFVLQRSLATLASAARDSADECHARADRLAQQVSSARGQAARKKAEDALEQAKSEAAQHEATASWLQARKRGIAVASGPMCAGTVTAQLHTGGAAALKGSTASEAAALGRASSTEAGVVDRSHRSLDRGAETAAMRRNARQNRMAARAAQSKSGPSVLAAASPRWFEVLGPVLGLCHHMLRLNERLSTRILCTEDVANAASHASGAGAVLDDVVMRELRMTNAMGSEVGQPGVITRPVGLYFQPVVGHDQEAQLTGGGLGNSARTSMQLGSTSGPANKRMSSRGMSTAPKGTDQGQWVTIHSVTLGCPRDARAPPLGWNETFEQLSSFVRKGNAAAAQDALKEYLVSGRAGSIAVPGSSPRESSPPQPQRDRSVSVASHRQPSDRDPVIIAWLKDLDAKAAEARSNNDHKQQAAQAATSGLR